MSRATKLRFGAIGVGNYALGYHLPIIKSSQDAELVAIHRRSPDRLADAAKSFKVAHAFTDYVAMLDSVELDAVVVSGPTGLHYEYCRAALEHGLHVLVDKPWVVRTAEAEDLLALARRKGLVLSVSYNRHFDPANMCARNVMQSGQLGEIICASALQLGFPSPDDRNWLFDPKLGVHGPLLGRGTHMVDLIPWATGLLPTEVTCSLVWRDGLSVDIGGSMTLKMEGEVLAQIATLMKQERDHDEVWVVVK